MEYFLRNVGQSRLEYEMELRRTGYKRPIKSTRRRRELHHPTLAGWIPRILADPGQEGWVRKAVVGNMPTRVAGNIDEF